MKSFAALLASSAAAYGHLCPGQVVGVRMAMLGCRLIGLEEPTNCKFEIGNLGRRFSQMHADFKTN